MFTDNWTVDNSQNPQPLTVSFHLELYEWVNGVPGNRIMDQWVGAPPLGHVTPAFTTETGTLMVFGTYGGWNGNPGCQLSFHVYRHAGSPNANNARSDWY